MTVRTRPISIRLTESEIEHLHARAHTLSATTSGGARNLRSQRQRTDRFDQRLLPGFNAPPRAHAHAHTVASGVTGEPTAPGRHSGGAVRRK